ncbi:MAG: alpha/beta fold hydrolase [Asticcacaulis sp.]|uniref:alpha/beta fold hydrolase n=1 Tax=Asticcacaulis sp. TaxID=1872648 RepID=UPI0039E33DD6
MSETVAASLSRPSRRMSLALREGHSRGSLSYLEMGNPDGPCLVFIHGFGADLLAWHMCLVPLVTEFRLVALDLPGHGRSTLDVGDASLEAMTEWLDEALDLLDVREAGFVAHSMGAKIALGYALLRPERVSRLALIAPAGLGGVADHGALNQWLQSPSLERAEAFARRLAAPGREDLVRVLGAGMMDTVANPQRLDALRYLLNVNEGGAMPSFQSNATFNGGELTQLRCPILVMRGDHDVIVPPPHEGSLPLHSCIRLLPGVGHLPHMEAPREVIAELKVFFRG